MKGFFHRNGSRDRIIVFGRYPIPGKVKTRLIPALGKAGAAELQRHLTEKTLLTVKTYASINDVQAAFCLDGGSRERIRRWLGKGLLFTAQGEGGLGDRMMKAFKRAFSEGCTRVVLLGTDIPDLGITQLEEAFEGLKENDVVLGPSTDGGYWLIGLRRPVELFRGIHWGTDGVLEETLELAKKNSLKTWLLRPLTDIDTLDDLRRFGKKQTHKGPYISVIIPALNEEEKIRETIESAKDPDAEIIVVDGGSRDGTKILAETTGAKVLQGVKGRGAQQNKGARASKGQVVLFLHADTRLPIGYVNHVFETLMPLGTAGGAFRFKTDARVPFIHAVERVTDFRSRCIQLPYGDQALFLKKDVFDSVGGFPEVSLAEDLLLVRKLQKLGRVRIAEAPVVTSGRRWRKLGVIETTLINQIILFGLALGVSPETLAKFYRPRRNPFH